MTICDSVQRQLAETGVAAAEAEDIARHLEGCAACSKYVADLRTIDAGLIELTSHDAPDALVADTLAAVRAAGRPDMTLARPGQRQRWLARGLAGGAVIAASLALTLNLIDPALRDSALVAEKPTSGDAVRRDGLDSSDDGAVGQFFGQRSPQSVIAAEPNAEQVLSESESATSSGPAPSAQQQRLESGSAGDYRVRGDRARNERVADELAQTKSPESQESGAAVSRELDLIARVAPEDVLGRHAGSAGAAEDRERFGDRAQGAGAPAAVAQSPVPAAPVGGKAKVDADGRVGAQSAPQRLPMPAQSEVGEGRASALSDLNKEAPAKDPGSEEAAKQQPRFEGVLKNLHAGIETARDKSADQPASAPAESAEDEKKNRANLSDDETGPASSGSFAEGMLHSRFDAARGFIIYPHEYAHRFLREHRSLDGLMFQDPAGYWANTYIPGDPQIRVLEARLAAWDRSALGQYSRLEQDVQPGIQPFDAPAGAALAVTMVSDTTAIDGPTRLRVQIGLKGAERLGGRRPAMNIGLVVDLRSLADAETGARIRALIGALERAQQPGDRFSLTVAGPAGGLLVAPEQFRHGPVQVALERMFNAPATAGEALSLPAAMNLASETVRAGDDPQSVLGSSLVILVTGNSLAGDVDALAQMAHGNAVAGIPLSVVSLAGRDELTHIDRLVAAGQGNRRVLDAAQAADALVDRELHSASRAVARALRLRIRLAPGVKLVSVLDSHRLGEPQAAQVRQAEVSIDQRLARNLGIAADRGQDEQGIQMVIPNFFAGDSHVVLLDVVADKAGPVADVTVRYKDVVNLGNGVAQASLALDDTPREAGPLERNVLKNLVAVEFATQARLASRELANGDVANAAMRLNRLKILIVGLSRVVPGWQVDPALIADQQALEIYLGAIGLPQVRDPGLRQLLADSLQVAAHRKLQPDVPR